MKKLVVIVLLFLMLSFFSPERLSNWFGLPDISTSMDRWKKHAAERTDYCGKIGNNTYRFPIEYLDWTVQYEGDPAWSPREDWVIRGCDDRFVGFLTLLDRVSLTLIKGSWAEHEHQGFAVLVYQGDSASVIEGVMSSYRRYQRLPELGDRIDPQLGVNFFDTGNDIVKRIFILPYETASRLSYADCSVSTFVRKCNLVLVSAVLGGRISVIIEMSDLRRWRKILSAAEAELLKFKVET